MSNLVTIKQAVYLRNLGFNEYTMRYGFKFFENTIYKLQQTVALSKESQNDKRKLLLSVPTVDQAIDWVRRKYGICIYDKSEPFVDPIKNHIVYAYAVKKCDKKRGWNYRTYIGNTNWSKDSYAMKRQALWLAIRFIIKNVKRRTNSHHRR